MNFGDERLFFADLATEFVHPYYPEVVVGRQDQSPTLLAVTETLNDYSLAELPIRAADHSSTNESPAAAARHIEAIVGRFLDLQPHEYANLSVALYNCDSTGLPIATVDKLTAFKEDAEMRCSITLRHHDTAILGAVYGQLLESIDADPE